MKKEILYPIFLECSTIAENDFWSKIFEDLAYGNTPFGVYISKDYLCCNYKSAPFSYKIKRKNPKKVYDEVYNLLNNKLGLLSDEEKNIKINICNKLQDTLNNEYKSWESIRKKNIKELLIEIYVGNMKKKYNLSFVKSKKLLSIIYMGIIFKCINNADINYSNGLIHSINGISFEENKIIINKDKIHIKSISKKNTKQKNRKLLSDLWYKYIKDLRESLKVK